jgi:hypothetical protein
VIVLLTDGAPTSNDRTANPASRIIAAAKARGIKIFTIALGLTPQSTSGLEGIKYLDSLANETDAASFVSNDCGSLQGAFESITDIVSRGSITREPFSIFVTAPLLVSTGTMSFDTTYIHGEICDTMTLTNVGEGDAVVDAADFADLTGATSGEFFLGPDVTPPLVIPESGQLKVPICFRPDGLRQRRGVLTFRYNNCGIDVRADSLVGTGYAEANLRVSDEYAALPGNTVTMPIYGDSTLTNYGVMSITYTVRWNKTMLYLKDVQPGAAVPGATIAAKPTLYGDRYATAEITVSSSSPIVSSGELARLQFEVMRGDTLATIVEVTEGTFEDGNPKTILNKETGLVAFDSTCFRSSKAIRRRTAAKIAAGDATPTPVDGTTVTIPVTATDQTVATVEIYHIDGTLALPRTRRQLNAGANTVSIDLGTLPAGTYYAILRTPEGETELRNIILAR